MSDIRARRVLRVLEYIGTDDFIKRSIEDRSVKGTRRIAGYGEIREAVLGDTTEVLTVSVDTPLLGDEENIGREKA